MKKSRRGLRQHPRKKRCKLRITNALWPNVLSFLDNLSIVKLAPVSTRFYVTACKMCIDVCQSEMEDTWNKLALFIVKKRCAIGKPCSRSAEFNHLCERGFVAEETSQLKCSVYPDKYHFLSVQHDSCPRECAVLSRWEGGHQHGWTLLPKKLPFIEFNSVSWVDN